MSVDNNECKHRFKSKLGAENLAGNQEVIETCC